MLPVVRLHVCPRPQRTGPGPPVGAGVQGFTVNIQDFSHELSREPLLTHVHSAWFHCQKSRKSLGEI